jgi:acetyltransferase
VFDSLEIASKCIGVLCDYGNYLHSYEARTTFELNWSAKARRKGQAILARAREEGRNALLEHEARDLLSMHGADCGTYRLARTAKEAVEAAAAVEGPVAMKVVSPAILHKSDAGGVKLDVRGAQSVRQAFREIREGASAFDPDAEVRGVLVAPMAEPGIEIIVGTKVDDQFGPVIMFGIGGIMVEVLKDVAFRVLPISNRSARMMIDEIGASRLLDGYRGRPPADKKAIRKLLLTVSEVIEAYPEIREMDLNPVIVHQDGLVVVDARILLNEP